jgi:predicted nuclease of restriction endonuclease-like RecB superfamily
VDYTKPKYALFSTDRDVSNVILNIFISDLNKLDKELVEQLKLMDSSHTHNGNIRGSLIKVLMITQSGSAGISFENVRQVHIMEPYRNKSRIDQVIGHANRTFSAP